MASSPICEATMQRQRATEATSSQGNANVRPTSVRCTEMAGVSQKDEAEAVHGSKSPQNRGTLPPNWDEATCTFGLKATYQSMPKEAMRWFWRLLKPDLQMHRPPGGG